MSQGQLSNIPKEREHLELKGKTTSWGTERECIRVKKGELGGRCQRQERLRIMPQDGQVRQRQKLDLTTIWWPFPELIQVSGGGEGARMHAWGWNVNEKFRDQTHNSLLLKLETQPSWHKHLWRAICRTCGPPFCQVFKVLFLHQAGPWRAVYSNLFVWSPEKHPHIFGTVLCLSEMIIGNFSVVIRKIRGNFTTCTILWN